MKPYEVKVDSKYGARMGRRSDISAALNGRCVHVDRVKFVDGDYDKGGAYWGGGRDSDPVFCAYSDDEYERVVYYFRTSDLRKARRIIKDFGATIIPAV